MDRDRYGTPLVPRPEALWDRSPIIALMDECVWWEIVSYRAADLYCGGPFHRRVPFA